MNYFLRPRGPDVTVQTETLGFTWVHNLLHMTGSRLLQPFLTAQTGAMFNGEIYDYQELARARGLHFQPPQPTPF